MVSHLGEESCQREDCEIKRSAAELQKEMAERRQVEGRLADAQRIAHTGHWDWDIVTNELSWSDEIYRIFGLQPQEFAATYEAFLERIHSGDRDFVIRAVNRALLEGAAYSIDHRIVRPGGEIRIVHEQAEVSFDDQGRACRMLGTAQDVTESRTISMELERKEEMLRRVLEALPVGVWIADETGRITASNRAAREIWGAAPHVGLSEYKVYKSWDLTTGQRLCSEDWAMARALLTGKPQGGREARIETFDGKERVIRTWGVPVTDSTGKLTGAIAVAEDITSQFAATQALHRSGEELRKLTQHQIRIRELDKAATRTTSQAESWRKNVRGWKLS
jgi:PAS domain S-box-containing protein